MERNENNFKDDVELFLSKIEHFLSDMVMDDSEEAGEDMCKKCCCSHKCKYSHNDNEETKIDFFEIPIEFTDPKIYKHLKEYEYAIVLKSDNFLTKDDDNINVDFLESIVNESYFIVVPEEYVSLTSSKFIKGGLNKSYKDVEDANILIIGSFFVTGYEIKPNEVIIKGKTLSIIDLMDFKCLELNLVINTSKKQNGEEIKKVAAITLIDRCKYNKEKIKSVLGKPADFFKAVVNINDLHNHMDELLVDKLVEDL